MKNLNVWWLLLGVIVMQLIFSCVYVAWADTDIVAQTIAYEASGEPFEAQVWVARVIIVRSIERSKTYEEICLQPYQFSCWNKGANLKKRTVNELQIARNAFQTALQSTNLPKINLYHDSSIKPPYWANKAQFVKQVGRLLFYKEKRGA